MSTRWKVLVPESMDKSGFELVESFATIDTYPRGFTSEELRGVIGEYDALVHRALVVDESVIAAGEKLRVISKHGIGVDKIDLETAGEHGVVVCNTPGANSRSVAELAFTLLLGVWKDIRRAHRAVCEDEWRSYRKTSGQDVVPNVEGATLGIFGCGNIGTKSAAIGQGLGLECIGYDPYLTQAEFPDGVTKIESKRELFAQADAVTIHVPLTDETEKAIATAELEALGEDGILVNTARGPVVDEAALIEALDQGVIRGAGLDVFEEEPTDLSNPLLERDDVMVSPHVGAVSSDSYEQMSRHALDNVRVVYEGSVPESIVNEQYLD